MAGDSRAAKNGKYNYQTKNFLKEACALIELGNLVESFVLGRIELSKPCICNDRVDAYNKIQRDPKKLIRESPKGRASVSCPKTDARCQEARRRQPTLDNAPTRHVRKTIEPKPHTFTFKSHSKDKLQCLKAEAKVHKDINCRNLQKVNSAHKMQSLPPRFKKGGYADLKESIINKQNLASGLDMAKCMQLYLLNERRRSGHEPSLVHLPKTGISKRTLKTRKNCSSFSHVNLFNRVSIKQKTNKRELSKNKLMKSFDNKPSLEIKLKEPNSKTTKLQIKSKRESCMLNKNISGRINVGLPYKCDLSAHHEPINKLSTSLSSSILTEQSARTPSAQTSNDGYISFRKPYAKTQAVYNVYDVTRYQQPGEMKGIRSHVGFSLNIDRGPKTTQDRGQVYPLSAPPSGKLDRRQLSYNSKANFGSGSTSLQQSFSLSRKTPQSETPYESDVYSPVDHGTPSSDCDTCCQANGFRTGQQIDDGVRDDYNATIINSPFAYLKKCIAGKYKCNDCVEAQTRSVGSCTCSPFIETDRFSVEVENPDPECSYLKRFFGKLLFNNTCVVCTHNKRVGTKYRPLSAYECEPDKCVDVKPCSSILTLLKKMCKKKAPEEAEIYKKLAKEEEKKKAREEKIQKKRKKQQRALAKAKKEYQRRKEIRKRQNKKEPVLFMPMTSI